MERVDSYYLNNTSISYYVVRYHVETNINGSEFQFDTMLLLLHK